MKNNILKRMIISSFFTLIGIAVTFGQLNLVPGENKVTYLSGEEEISALLYVPADFQEGEKRPAIVITRPASGVKEQTAGLYAQKLSEKGFITLAFDPRGFGESEGEVSQEVPYRIIEDTKNAISFIRTLKEVDRKNVFNMGICMGAGYAASTAAVDTRINATAMISPYLNMRDRQIGAVGGVDNFRTILLPIASNSRQSYYETGEDVFQKVVPETEEEIQNSLPVAVGMRDYYLPGEPGYHPNWKNQLSNAVLDQALCYSPFEATDLFNKLPFFLAVGTEAYTYDNTMSFYEQVNGPKEKYVVQGAGHFELYWMPEYVNPISEKIDIFFRKYVK